MYQKCNEALAYPVLDSFDEGRCNNHRLLVYSIHQQSKRLHIE
jgi:hypothetical protein